MEGNNEQERALKGKQKENIENNRETAFLSREIATIVTDLDFPLDLESVSFPAFDAADVEETFGKYQLASPLARVLAMSDAVPPSREAKLEVAPMLEGDAGAAEVARAVAAGETIGVVNLIAVQDVHQNTLLLTVSKVQEFFHSLYLKVVIVLSLLTLAVYGLWWLLNTWHGRKPNKKIHRR